MYVGLGAMRRCEGFFFGGGRLPVCFFVLMIWYCKILAGFYLTFSNLKYVSFARGRQSNVP